MLSLSLSHTHTHTHTLTPRRKGRVIFLPNTTAYLSMLLQHSACKKGKTFSEPRAQRKRMASSLFSLIYGYPRSALYSAYNASHLVLLSTSLHAAVYISQIDHAYNRCLAAAATPLFTTLHVECYQCPISQGFLLLFLDLFFSPRQSITWCLY